MSLPQHCFVWVCVYVCVCILYIPVIVCISACMCVLCVCMCVHVWSGVCVCVYTPQNQRERLLTLSKLTMRREWGVSLGFIRNLYPRLWGGTNWIHIHTREHTHTLWVGAHTHTHTVGEGVLSPYMAACIASWNWPWILYLQCKTGDSSHAV